MLSCLIAGLVVSLLSAIWGFVVWALAGSSAAAAGGGRRAGFLLTFLLRIVPYFGADSIASSAAQRTWISRVISESICKS